MTKEQIKNLMVFLKRTPLKGEEAPVLMDIIKTLEEDNKPKLKKDVKDNS